MSPKNTVDATDKKNPFTYLVDVIVGALIGLAEMVPGVSGGTVALVTGIYSRAIRNGDALLNLVKTMITDRNNIKNAAKQVEWVFLLCVGVGMIATVFGLSSVMHDFVANSPQTSRALFFGMVAVSLFVPIKMVGKEAFAKEKVKLIAVFVVAAVVIFFLTGLTSAEKPHPSLFIVFGAAAIAVCALVLPGVSGSFMLLALGLYQPIMGAVADRDLKVLLVFVLGAITGLALFIKLLNFLMTKHHAVTMTAMAGFMLGSLRALWPWQGADASLEMPSGNVAWTIFVIVIGVVIAGGIMVLERFTEKDAPAE